MSGPNFVRVQKQLGRNGSNLDLAQNWRNDQDLMILLPILFGMATTPQVAAGHPFRPGKVENQIDDDWVYPYFRTPSLVSTLKNGHEEDTITK